MSWQIKFGNDTLVSSSTGTFDPPKLGKFHREYITKQLHLGNYGLAFDNGLAPAEHQLTVILDVETSAVSVTDSLFQGLNATAETRTLQIPDMPDLPNCVLTAC